MTITDLFSTSFLFSIAIILILIGGIFMYVSYRIGEQDHKLNSMIGLVSTMAEESQFFRSRLNLLQQKMATPDLPEVEKIQYASQMMGGTQDELIDVSDNDEDDEDDEADDDDENDDEDDEDEDEEDEDEDEDEDDDDEDNEDDEDNIKRINLNLEDEYLNAQIPYEEIDTDSESYKETNNLVFNNTKDLEDLESSNELIDIINQLKEDEPDVKSILITDLGEDITNLPELDNNYKTDYKKMTINKLRDTVVSKGIIADASKLKKHEILKLLGDE